MNRASNSLLIFIIAVIIAGCGKCANKETGSYRFTADELRINPYNGGEILHFRSVQANDSLEFSVGPRIRSTTRVYPIYVDNGECNNNYTTVETNANLIVAQSRGWQFSIFLRFYPHPTMSQYYKAIEFEASVPGLDKAGRSKSTLMFEQDTLTGYIPYWPYGNLIFYTVMTFNSAKSFPNVYEINTPLQETVKGIWIKTVYYNTSLGIVGFCTSAGEMWYLD